MQEPSSQESITPGENVQFVVKAAGMNLFYTWHHQTSKRTSQKNVVGNDPTLYIDKVKPDDEGFYTCTISNTTGGTVETNPAQLTTSTHCQELYSPACGTVVVQSSSTYKVRIRRKTSRKVISLCTVERIAVH